MSDTLIAILDDLYSDPNGARAVQYTPVGGSTVTVSALKREQMDTIDVLLGASAQRAGTSWEVRENEVPIEPQEGDTITDDLETFTVRVVREDSWRMRWFLECDLSEAEVVIGVGHPAQLPLLVGLY